jgi:succinate-semialdehyde dehydrogenase/glutarate-semialdehyde dehydrogenase
MKVQNKRSLWPPRLYQFIVFDDANIDSAVTDVVTAKFINVGLGGGTYPDRVYVQSSIYDEFSALLVERVSALRVGPPTDRLAQTGPMTDAHAVAKIARHVEDAVERGANLLIGGRRLDALGPDFFAPTVLANVERDMLLCREVAYGPLAPLFRFEGEQEIVDLANAASLLLHKSVHADLRCNGNVGLTALSRQPAVPVPAVR